RPKGCPIVRSARHRLTRFDVRFQHSRHPAKVFPDGLQVCSWRRRLIAHLLASGCQLKESLVQDDPRRIMMRQDVAGLIDLEGWPRQLARLFWTDRQS